MTERVGLGGESSPKNIISAEWRLLKHDHGLVFLLCLHLVQSCFVLIDEPRLVFFCKIAECRDVTRGRHVVYTVGGFL